MRIRKRKRELLTSLTFLRYLPTPNYLKRVVLELGDFQKQESKRTLHYMSVMSLLCHHTLFLFWGYTLFLIFSANSSNPMIRKVGKGELAASSK